MSGKIVTVFGASGFLGRHVVRALCRDGWRVRAAMRRPHLGGDLRLSGDVGQVQLFQANVRNRDSIRRALDGADAVINLVAILYERGAQTFAGVQAEGAKNVAEIAAEQGVTDFVYISAIGASKESRSKYAHAKADAEAATREAIPSATILRPSIIFGPEDGFFTRFAEMARLTPVLPVIGGGSKFQPVYVGDVADAIAAAIGNPEARGKTYELGGPRVYTMRELMKFTMRQIDRPRLLTPLPWIIASPLGYTIGALSKLNPFFGPPLTGDQVQLLRDDNVVADDALTLADLGVTNLETIEAIAPTYLWRHRPYGQFHMPDAHDVSRVDA